jgi:hypothetical protein
MNSRAFFRASAAAVHAMVMRENWLFPLTRNCSRAALATPDGRGDDQKQEKQRHDYRWDDPLAQTRSGQQALLFLAGAFLCPQSPIEAVEAR